MEQPNLAIPDPDAEQVLAERALRAVRAEVAAEDSGPDDAPGDGSVVVTLYTRRGEGKFRVPPYNEWGSVARNALRVEDDLTWAQRTLTPLEALEWAALDPTVRNTEAFFTAWGEALGQDLKASTASRSSSRGSRGR